jgi:hypothetical protein
MLSKLLIAFGLMAACVVIHATGVTSAMRWLRRQPALGAQLWRWIWLFICLAAWMILLHLGEVVVWAVFYAGVGVMPDLASAFYFSAVTYTTTGYGDLVLPERWRVVGGIEALTGILMCGWSTGFFYAVVSKLYEAPRANSAS